MSIRSSTETETTTLPTSPPAWKLCLIELPPPNIYRFVDTAPHYEDIRTHGVNDVNINCYYGLVIAGISDLTRPAEQLSTSQTMALAATGCIWCRYSLVVIPKNYNLFSVNFFVATTQLYQLYRAFAHQRSLKEQEGTNTVKQV
ncbi:hypothetical protein FQR65_LT14408 [Abscondita terminalis]|nr:hypothetical protein FQR65_LT14408 [Abscondita terminalis]